MSSGIIVHSRYANDLVSAQVPNKYIRVVPMGVPLDGPQTPSHVLASRYGLQPKDFVLASISTLAMTKRLDVALCVVHRLRPEMPHLKFLVVGGGNLADEARNMIRRYGLKDSVVSTGWVTSSDYRGLIALADIVLDLRHPSGAETSASITRAMAVGRPLIVSAQGSFLELPDGCSIKIPVGPGEVARICGAVQQLATDPVLRGSMGRFARAYSESNFRLEQAARAYVEFAAEIARSPKEHRNLVPWPAVDARSPAAGLVSAIYKLTRIAYLYRNYGWSDTLRRVREEIRLRNLSEPEGT